MERQREHREEINLSGDSDEDDNVPDVATCQKLVEQFAELTNTDEACAQFYLQDRQWDLERAVNAFFEAKTGGIKVLQDGDEPEVVVTFDSKLVSVLEEGVMTEEAPKKFCFMTWNIDGLDEKNLKKRTKAVATIIDREKADIVFLQEAIPNTFTYLEQLLPQFLFIAGGVDNYFTLTLLRRTTVHFDDQTLEPFANTSMGRNLLCVEAHIGDLKLHLLNSHLESTAEFTRERVEQLKLAFTKMKGAPPGVTTLFGGDLNLRDKEFPGRFKPRLRFDRVYLHAPSGSTPTAVPLHFGLVGLQRVTNTQSFPSDHWGIVVHFEIGKKGSGGIGVVPSTNGPSTSSQANSLKRKR